MMIIRDKQSLRISGKGWEVRAKLRELSKSEITLQDYLRYFENK